VKVVVVPSSVPGPDAGLSNSLISYVVNDTVAIDAGCIGLYGDWQQQARIKHVFLSHTHMDHVASLPMFLENVFQSGGDPVTVYGSQTVLDGLQRDLFNDRLWPDFVALSKNGTEFLRLQTLEDGKTVTAAGLRITPCPVNHVVPTLGFFIEEDRSAVLVVSDTGPTKTIWERARRTPNLKAVFLEASFPNALAWLADVSKHLTPQLFAQEVQKLGRPAAVIAVHIKARYYPQVIAELQALRLSGMEPVCFGRPYQF
jgi:ribonuclease BN (tRNA processing enzyme)